MKIKKLDQVSRTRLAELVSVYMDPPESFKINSKGEVSFNKEGPIMRYIRKLDDISYDFMESMSQIIEGIGNALGENKAVGIACEKAFKCVVTNERESAIRYAYSAHLMDPVDGKSVQRSPKVEVTIEKKFVGEPIFRTRTLAKDVEEILNSADIVVYGRE